MDEIRFTKVELMETRYNDLSYLFLPVEQINTECDEILESLGTIDFGC